ncbi:MAG: Crp/Fnr family transcriptional regulator [Bacteroidales bacterium]
MESFSKHKRWDNELTPEQKQLVQDHSTVLHFEANETIIKQGIAASHIMYLEEGMAKLSVRHQERLTTFKIVPADNFIGIMCSFVKRSFDFYAIAIKPSTVRLIDRNIFEDLIRHNGHFAVQMVELMSLSTNKIVHDLITISQKNVDGAICTILLEMSRIFKSDSFQMPFTRIELADMIGYSKESVIHSLSSLQREDILRISAKNVEILDRKRLELISRHG